jgi:hypothetical protein
VALLGSLRGWSIKSIGRVSEVSEREITFVSLDEQASVVIDLSCKGVDFEYTEPRALPESLLSSVPEEALSASCVLIGLPKRERESERETLFLSELPG